MPLFVLTFFQKMVKSDLERNCCDRKTQKKYILKIGVYLKHKNNEKLE